MIRLLVLVITLTTAGVVILAVTLATALSLCRVHTSIIVVVAVVAITAIVVVLVAIQLVGVVTLLSSFNIQLLLFARHLVPNIIGQTQSVTTRTILVSIIVLVVSLALLTVRVVDGSILALVVVRSIRSLT